MLASTPPVFASEESPLPDTNLYAPVIPPAELTEVKIGLYLIALDRVSGPGDAFPTFKVEMFMDLQWKDERLAFDEDEYGFSHKVYEEHSAALELEKIWWSDVEIENEVGNRITENLELIIFPDGTIEYEERFVVEAHADFDFHRFPFDRQEFELDLESFAWDKRYLVFTPNEKKIGFDPHFSGTEWEIENITTTEKFEDEIRSDEQFSEFIYIIEAARHRQFHIMKIIPLLIIIMFSWSVFWMEGESPSGRMGRSFIALLTVVAFHRVFSGFLPRLSYSTLLDGVVIVGYLFTSVAIVENVIVHQYIIRDDQEGANKIDRISRWIIPLSFLIACIVLVIYYI